MPEPVLLVTHTVNAKYSILLTLRSEKQKQYSVLHFFYTCLCNFASVKTQKSRIYHSYVVAGLCSVPDAITSQQNKAPTPEVQESTIYLLQWPTVRVCSLLPLRAEVHRRG